MDYREVRYAIITEYLSSDFQYIRVSKKTVDSYINILHFGTVIISESRHMRMSVRRENGDN